MKVDVLLGLQWGDEGKGKIVDVLTNNYDIIARFQGGPNAGHTLEFDGIKHVLHTIPSGIFHKGIINLIGNGVVHVFYDVLFIHRLSPDVFHFLKFNIQSRFKPISQPNQQYRSSISITDSTSIFTQIFSKYT